MQAWHKMRRAHEYSVHMKADEVPQIINECADAVNAARTAGLDLPALEALHTHLNRVYGAKGTKRG